MRLKVHLNVYKINQPKTMTLTHLYTLCFFSAFTYIRFSLPCFWKIIEFLCHKLGFGLSIYLQPGNSVNLDI